MTALRRPRTWQLIKDSAGPMALATVKAVIPLTIISFAIGLAIALVVALMRLSSVKLVSQDGGVIL